MCTRTGCLVEAKALTVCLTPRIKRLKLLAFGIEKVLSPARSGGFVLSPRQLKARLGTFVKFVIISFKPVLFKLTIKRLRLFASQSLPVCLNRIDLTNR